jgi:hypothetical protein
MVELGPDASRTKAALDKFIADHGKP